MSNKTIISLGWMASTALLVLSFATLWLGFTRPSRADGLEISLVPFNPLYVAAEIAFVVVGAIVLSRRPHLRVGWFFVAFGALGILTDFGYNYGVHSLLNRHTNLPGGPLFVWWYVVSGPLLFMAFVLMLLHFPTGRLPSSKWNWTLWLAWANVAVAVATAVAAWPLRGRALLAEELHGLGVVSTLTNIGFALSVVLLAAALASLYYRFRRVGALERNQIKWLALGGTVVLIPIVFGFLPEYFFGDPLIGPWDPLIGVGLLAVPVGAGIAILRYHLYDIDLIINRTLVYGALTAVLALVYVAGVVGVGSLVRGATGQDNSLVVAASTLVVAGLFRPARARIQGFIDRRFYRRRYDAARTVEAFSARLRDEVELDAIRADLLTVVRDTMQPAHAYLWLKV
jgi:hypothetical protein